MTLRIEWSKHAQADRETIYAYLYYEAGLQVANMTDGKLINMISILKENPQAGMKSGQTEKRRKLVVPKFPFIIVYVTEQNLIHIVRILHTSQKIAGRYCSR